MPGTKFYLRVGCFWGCSGSQKTSNSCLRARFVVFFLSSQVTFIVCAGPHLSNWQGIITPKSFDNFYPEGGCSDGLDALNRAFLVVTAQIRMSFKEHV